MDLNGDGLLDILTGSWPGEIYLFPGGPEHTFAAPEVIKGHDGYPINAGGGVHVNDERILITGTVVRKKTDEGNFVEFRGKLYKSTAELPVWSTGTASAAHAADWDGDGDLDLLIGDIRGRVYLVMNEGTPRAYRFAKEQALLADGKAVAAGRTAGPFVADWDGDGDLDLLVSSGDGGVQLYRNQGTRKAPELSAAEQLVPPGFRGSYRNPPEDVRRGTRSRVCVVDWNCDGKLDLLVGDLTRQKPKLPEPTEEQKVEWARLRAELAEVESKLAEIRRAMRQAGGETEEEKSEALKKEYSEALSTYRKLRSKLPSESETHGWIWYFRRL